MSEDQPSERQRILEMLEQGKITAGEAARLINALNDIDEPEPQEWVDTVEVESAPKPHEMERFRHFWQIPFIISLSFTFLIAAGLYAYGTSGGESGFAYFCLGNLLVLTVIATLLSFATRFSWWLHLRVEEKQGKKIAISLPLFMPLITLVMRFARGYVQGETAAQLENAETVIRAFRDGGDRSEPLMLHVDDDDGDKVQIYIG